MPSQFSTLTDYEQLSLPLSYDLANGHAYHEFGPNFGDVIGNLQNIWATGANTSVTDLERDFRLSFASLIGSKGLLNYEEVMISPTASNSIDIVGAYLARKNVETILLEPTFDNLALLFSRRGAAIRPMQEHLLVHALCSGSLDTLFDRYPTAGAIFVVNPNNPTGQTIDTKEFQLLCDTCAQRGLIMIIDNTFRLYNRAPFDDYAILHDSGVSFISIEDTGKTWPTQDLKLSMMVSSSDHVLGLGELYRELYLCPSLFALALFQQIFERTERSGLSASLWNLVDSRRKKLRQVLEGSNLLPQSSGRWSPLPVEWLKIDRLGRTDLDICHELSKLDLGVLPGRHFFWSTVRSAPATGYVRISLLKPDAEFEGGLKILAEHARRCMASLEHS